MERKKENRKWGNVESESLSISSFSLHFLFIFSFSLHFLAARLPACNKLCNPDSSYAIALVKIFCWLQKNFKKNFIGHKMFQNNMYLCNVLYNSSFVTLSYHSCFQIADHIPRDIYLKYWLHRLVGEGIVRQYCGTTEPHTRHSLHIQTPLSPRW